MRFEETAKIVRVFLGLEPSKIPESLPTADYDSIKITSKLIEPLIKSSKYLINAYEELENGKREKAIEKIERASEIFNTEFEKLKSGSPEFEKVVNLSYAILSPVIGFLAGDAISKGVDWEDIKEMYHTGERLDDISEALVNGIVTTYEYVKLNKEKLKEVV